MTSFQDELSRHFDKPLVDILKFARYASRRYKTYLIPKRTGGFRQISQPSAELKKYQNFIKTKIFSKLKIHKAVYSYREQKNIHKMALEHKGAKFLLRIDFTDFFPSIQDKHLRHYFSNDKELTMNDITLINLLVFKANKLTIGAPSSPIISNFILYDLDEFLYTKSKELGIKYTRYADDLYFSTSEHTVLEKILPILRTFLKESFFIKLLINNKKTISTSKKQSQRITGLTLTTDNNITVGRKKKRYIKSLIFKYINKTIELDDEKYLKGYLSYLYSIEPTYIKNLEEKYSRGIIKELLPIKIK